MRKLLLLFEAVISEPYYSCFWWLQKWTDAKDMANVRWTKEKVGTHVKLSTLRMKKEVFLNNQEYKQLFIDVLGACFSSVGVDVLHALGDADKMILQSIFKRKYSYSDWKRHWFVGFFISPVHFRFVHFRSVHFHWIWTQSNLNLIQEQLGRP